MRDHLHHPRRLFAPLSRERYTLIACASFALMLAVWVTLSRTLASAEVFLPSPWKVLQDGVALFRTASFHRDILASVWRVMAGFVLALLTAVPLGIAAGVYRTVDAAVQPINDFVRYLPVAALVPLTILWVGIDDGQKILVIYLGTVFQLLPLVTDTTRLVPHHLVDLGYSMGCSSVGVIMRVITPWCLPVLYDHARVALGWAWSYLVVAELVAATSGIGHVIIQSQRFIQTGQVLFGIVVIGMLGLMFDLMFRTTKRRFFPWA